VIFVLLLAQLMVLAVLNNLLHQALIAGGLATATQRTPLLIHSIQVGFIGGVASGLGSLGVYNVWRNRQLDNNKLTWSAVLCYLQPWGGMLLGAIIGSVLFLVLGTNLAISRTTETWFRGAGFFAGLIQFYVYPLLVSKINAVNPRNP
jgi:hypothetical protein